MDFALTQEQKLLIDTAESIADEYGPEYWYTKEENEEYGVEFWDALADGGLHGCLVPEEYGGAGMGMQEMALAIETLVSNGTGIPGSLYLLLTGTMATTVLRNHATAAQNEELLPQIASGDLEFCHGITEAGAGTNTLNIQTFAELDGDTYQINGEKTWITWSDKADKMLLVTRTTERKESDPAYGITLFLVDMPDPAIDVEPIPLHGMNTSHTCQLYINDLTVPAENVVGAVDEGWEVLLDALNPERLCWAPAATGLGRCAIDHAAEYANERQVFDAPIGSHQGVQHPLAKAYSQLEAASQMRMRAAWSFDGGQKSGLETNIAKAVSVEAGIEAVYHAMQTFGGAGYARENHVERWWREVNLTRLAPVTQQMAYNYIAENGLGLPRSY
jgi:acyl-CoA dehydrogenase